MSEIIKNKPICFFFIHGLGGTVEEITPLTNMLRCAGFNCYVTQLVGHPQKGKRIENVHRRVWILSIKKEYLKLKNTYNVIAVGFSMGGLIASVINKTLPFSGMVFINTPIYFWNLPEIAKNILTAFGDSIRYYLFESASRVTVYTMFQFLCLLFESCGTFKYVKSPSLVIQSVDDDSVWPQSAMYIYKRLAGEKNIFYPQNGRHQVLSDRVQCKKICDKIIEFTKTFSA